ncbi:hypothetical protein RIU81_15605 [Salmonella enterica subsp. enterica serovar Gatineau]|uniref:hypothetical protein n=1 Tax=Salmonella enterica TaxID=28901 RepID=UPI0028624F96|nr:hypothetical protein [Salmonella enterica]MDR7936687.1 hypothetical protein [Salmonella enterica subsp. enterica serovar Gatineau]
MVKYEFSSSPTSHVLSVDPMARVKQVTIWGDAGDVTVSAAANAHSPFEPVIDRATGEQLVVSGDSLTFTLTDYRVTNLKLEAVPTGTWYVALETWG